MPLFFCEFGAAQLERCAIERIGVLELRGIIPCIDIRHDVAHQRVAKLSSFSTFKQSIGANCLRTRVSQFRAQSSAKHEMDLREVKDAEQTQTSETIKKDNVDVEAAKCSRREQQVVRADRDSARLHFGVGECARDSRTLAELEAPHVQVAVSWNHSAHKLQPEMKNAYCRQLRSSPCRRRLR